jgi:hypothetical protein
MKTESRKKDKSIAVMNASLLFLHPDDLASSLLNSALGRF